MFIMNTSLTIKERPEFIFDCASAERAHPEGCKHAAEQSRAEQSMTQEAGLKDRLLLSIFMVGFVLFCLFSLSLSL